MLGGQKYKVCGGQTREGGGGQKSSLATSGSVLLRTMEKRRVATYTMQRRERGARPGVANYWIRARVLLVLQTANSCSFQKIFAKKSSS